MPDELKFIANYKGWSMEKRLQVSESTPDSEVAKTLSEIRGVASAKAFELIGIDVSAIKSFAASEASGKSGAQSLTSLNQSKIRAKLKEFCKEESQLPFAEALFNQEILRLLGVKTGV